MSSKQNNRPDQRKTKHEKVKAKEHRQAKAALKRIQAATCNALTQCLCSLAVETIEAQWLATDRPWATDCPKGFSCDTSKALSKHDQQATNKPIWKGDALSTETVAAAISTSGLSVMGTNLYKLTARASLNKQLERVCC